jgi:NAD(P)H-hydrate repair Nnr-like enzyme with NAD(P)H-hydrate dehydratase domain
MSTSDYWQKQQDKPLFPDLLWSRPENRAHAGKLLIIGGHAYNLNAPAAAYTAALAEGAGAIRTILPDKVKAQLKALHNDNLDMEFAPSTPSGSFASQSLTDMIDASLWADGILLAGDLGKNSETAIVLEKLVAKSVPPLVLTKDAADYFTESPSALVGRGHVCMVVTVAQLQKLATTLKFATPITFSMDLLTLVQALHDFTKEFSIYVVVKHRDMLFVAAEGRVSTTSHPAPEDMPWRVTTAAACTVWWMQNPSKPFEALTTAVHSS